MFNREFAEKRKRLVRSEPLELYSDDFLQKNIIARCKGITDFPKKHGIFVEDFDERNPEKQLDIKTTALAKLLFDEFRQYFATRPEYEFMFFLMGLARHLVLIVQEYGEEGKVVLDKVQFMIDNFAITGLAEIVTKKEKETPDWDSTNFATLIQDAFEENLLKISSELAVDLENPKENNELSYRLFQPNTQRRYLRRTTAD